MILRQPPLVRVGNIRVFEHAEFLRRGRIRHVRNGSALLVGSEANIFPGVSRIRPAVPNALRIVRVTTGCATSHGGIVAPCKRGLRRIAHVHDMRPRTAGKSIRRHLTARYTHDIYMIRHIVDHHIMRRSEGVIQGGGVEGRRSIGYIPKLRKVKYLHAVRTGSIGYNDGMIVHDLYVPPPTGPTSGRHR